MENKKIRNARTHEYNGILFKSGLEVTAYKELTSEGLNPEYEQHTFHVYTGKKFSVPCYDEHNDRKLKRNVWGVNTYKTQDIKYTPDFICYVPDSEGILRMMILEIKGYANDRYPYVKKMFMAWLEENAPHSLFFEVHNKKQLHAAIEVIKNIKTNNEEIV